MKKINLTNLNSGVLSKIEMSKIHGGYWATATCACACKYADKGGSSTSANGHANNSKGLHSPGKYPAINYGPFNTYPTNGGLLT